MMILSYSVDMLLAAVAVLMLLKGHYGVTRQMAFVPLFTAVADAAVASSITYTATPILSVALTLLQVVILVGSAAVLHQDRVRARNKQERRRRRREILRTQAAFEQARFCREKKADRVCA